jgi:hypothetical protein
VVTPEGLQAQESLVAFERPELTCAFEPSLVLAAGGLDGARTQGFVGFDFFCGGGGAFFDGFAAIGG